MAKAVIQMTIDDVDHISDEEKLEVIGRYAEHERDARIRGIPALGSGRVFPISEDKIVSPHVEIPNYWARIIGLDFGWDHPFAAVELAWDRDGDVIYVINAYKESQTTPVIHSAAIRPWGDWIPCAWPHDGLQHDKGSGKGLKDQYEEQGLNMLLDHAQYDGGDVSVEAGVMEMLDRMKTGRLKVFKHLNEWLQEFRLYHRKDGKIVKLKDDLLSATRYAIMMKRYAMQDGVGFHRKIEYPQIGIV